MILALKIITILSLTGIFLQDIKERMVYWFLFPLSGFLMASLHYRNTVKINFWWNIGINLSLVLVIIGIVYFYATFKMKVNFWENAFGFGDALFFAALSLSFPTVTFVILFTFALFFALVVSLFKKKQTIPLAGYMSLFISCVFLISWASPMVNLYNF